MPGDDMSGFLQGLGACFIAGMVLITSLSISIRIARKKRMERLQEARRNKWTYEIRFPGNQD
nr:hypothetical protein [Candidatus Sigynarchaeota archaeon]